VLDPSKESLWDTVHRLKDFGNSMFGYADIDFAVKGLTTELNDVALSMESRRALMMIFKEAMNNCMKYAAARRVELAVALKSGLLEIALTDDGKGFDVNAASNGYGMKTMKERAEKLDAALSIVSSPGKGTTIRFGGNIRQLYG
jgi:signal transduction histidine kinase